MLRLSSLAVIAASLGACASAPMTASNDAPAMQALLTSPRGDAELAGLPFDMVELLQARIGFELAPTDATEITSATTQALAAVTPGAEFLWASPDNTNGGEIRLWRLDAMGDGRICAILQHEHVIGDGTARGNVTTCRREGVGWWLDDWEWIITGRDFGGL
jgi:surface antigen